MRAGGAIAPGMTPSGREMRRRARDIDTTARRLLFSAEPAWYSTRLIRRAFVMHAAFADPAASIPSIPILFATAESWPAVRQSLAATGQFADAAGFEPKPGQHLLLPGGATGISAVLFGLPPPPDHEPFLPGRLPGVLPAGVYRFGNAPPNPRLAALGFALGTYRFSRYRRTDSKRVQLALPPDLDGDDLTRMVDAVVLARDLINTPANDLGPAELEEAGRALARRHDARISVVVGDDLLEQNFPLIHGVIPRPPR
jgi:leucyl aminopeptidase